VAVTSLTCTRTGRRTWRYEWTGGTPPYRIVRDGLTALPTTTATQYDVAGTSSTTAPVIEVLDAEETTAPSEDTPPWVHLQWRGYSGVDHYLVERFNGAAWEEQDRIYETGLGYYSWASDPEEDGATYQYRVTAVDSQGNTSPMVVVSGEMITVPSDPGCRITPAAGVVTVAAQHA
jgi:hypothetical protein